jgi:quinol-cytochrome oxidoreductase complex cytochrome b subunit
MHQEIPTGLLHVRDLIERHPKERERLVAYEIRRRERERLLYRGTRKLMHVHAWSSVKTVLALGLSVFFFAWTLGQLAQFAQWVREVQAFAVTIPIPLREDIKLELGKMVPTSTVLTFAAGLPAWDWRDAGVIALVAMALLLVEKIFLAYLTWKHARELRSAVVEIDEEIRVLKEWRGRQTGEGEVSSAL